MSALPLPEVPPPDTPDGHVPNPRIEAGCTPPREPAGRPVSATVRLALVDPTADADEIVAAAVSMITTTYTAPGERIMLAAPGVPETDRSRRRRDRLVESVLRLGRGAIANPASWPHGDHEWAAMGGYFPGNQGSGSGLGPNDAANPVSPPTDQHQLRDPSGPSSDSFELIIAGWSDHPEDPFAMPDWTSRLTPTGAVVVLTHSSDQSRARSFRSGQLSRAAASAGLTLTDRLILAHQSPSHPRPASRGTRRAIAFAGHRRIHTAASVFRRSTLSREARRV